MEYGVHNHEMTFLSSEGKYCWLIQIFEVKLSNVGEIKEYSSDNYVKNRFNDQAYISLFWSLWFIWPNCVLVDNLINSCGWVSYNNL